MIKAPVIMCYDVGQLEIKNFYYMKKLKLDKINLSEMKLDEMNSVNGGGNVDANQELFLTWKTVCGSLIRYTCAFCQPTRTNACSKNLSCRPGEQDSCGLCTTRYAC